MRSLTVCYLLITALVACPPNLSVAQEFSLESLAFFEQKIRPLLVEHCFECHSSNTESEGGLRLDSRPSILQGGDHGAAASLDNPSSSLLLAAVHYRDPDFEMPPNGKLSDKDIATFEQWVQMGVPYPAVANATKPKYQVDIEAGKKHWAFQNFQSIPLPALNASADWPNKRHDVWILAEQQKHSKIPNEAVAKETLLRRAKFSLLGLPATYEEIQSFAADREPDAFQRQLEKWLASPQYGERWGRSWLELVRYCDVPEQWTEVHHTYRYRDWVVQALNEDMSYARFMQLQLAADQISDARHEDLAALGFIGLSPTYWKELQLPVEIIKSIVSDEYEERIYSWSSTFLGVNLACARCHDHKTEPFTTQDYYAIAGVFANSRMVDRVLNRDIDSLKVLEAKKIVAELEPKITTVEKDIKSLETKQADGTIAADEQDRLTKMKMDREDLVRQLELAKQTPGYDLPTAPGTIDAVLEVKDALQGHGSRIVYADVPKDAAVEIRGNPNKLAEVVPRRYLSVLSSAEPPRFAQGSGRWELAHTMLEQSSPLMARVIVNRIWKLHFGRGIVETPSDFGLQGEPPTHPELLEDLAQRFIDNNWSLKWLHKEILLSSTYQQSSRVNANDDPSNHLYTRFPMRRLEVEAWRDAMLIATNQLDYRVGGAPLDLNQTDNVRRTIYGIVTRRELADILRLYDFPDPVTHSPQRLPTSTALQQLFVLNSSFMISQSQGLLRRIERVESTSEDARAGNIALDPIAKKIELAYRYLYGREPNGKEIEMGRAFVGDGSKEQWQLYCQALLSSNEFWFVD
jgi:hypothetical protein